MYCDVFIYARIIDKISKFLPKFSLQNVIPIFWYTYRQSANVFSHSISLVPIKGKANLISLHKIVQLSILKVQRLKTTMQNNVARPVWHKMVDTNETAGFGTIYPDHSL
jgi:hypothetical protein